MVGFTLDRNDEQDDRHSVHSIASTVATTTSLASRIRDLNLDFGDKLREQAEEEEQEEQKDADRRSTAVQSPVPEDCEQAGHVSEEHSAPVSGTHAVEDDLGVPHSLHLLHRDPPLQPLQVCCRLFERRSHPPLPLKRMSMVQVEDFRTHGYVVLDGMLTKEAAGRIKAEALRLAQKGLLQPVSQSNLGFISNSQVSTPSAIPAANGTCHGCSSSTSSSISSQAGALGSSPCRSANGFGPHPLVTNGVSSSSNGSYSRAAAAGAQHQQRPQQQQAPQQQQQQRPGELRLPLHLGHPPVDTAVFASLMAALQELQEDLSEFVRLRSKGSAEYCLCHLPSGSQPVPRHKDALVDDGRHDNSTTAAAVSGSSPPQQQSLQQQLPQQGSQQGLHKDALVDDGRHDSITSAATNAAAAAEVPGSSPPQQQPLQQQDSQQGLLQQQQQQQQRQQDGLQQMVSASAGSQSAAGGAAATSLGPAARRVSMFVFLNADWDKECGGVVRLWPPTRPTGPPSTAAASAARRSPTSSDAGTTFSELSDCGSLRVAFMGSTTSSVVAEASAPDHDTYSLDGISLAESEAERQGFEWVECDGGEMALDIAPLAGRVLLVLSGAVEHALLPGSGNTPGCDSVFVRAWCC